jgi:hypothetical protein
MANEYEEIADLKRICRDMQLELKSPFDELVQEAIGILVRKRIRDVYPIKGETLGG